MSLEELLVLLVPIGLGLLVLAVAVGAITYLFRLTRRVLANSNQGMTAMDEALELSRRTAAAQEEANRLLQEIRDALRARQPDTGR